MLAIFRQLYKTMTHNFCAKDSVLTKWFDPFSMSVYARRCEVELMHCESIDWNEAFLTKKGQLNGGKPLVSILFVTLYMISVSFTRISKLSFRDKKIVLSTICFYIFSFFFLYGSIRERKYHKVGILFMNAIYVFFPWWM